MPVPATTRSGGTRGRWPWVVAAVLAFACLAWPLWSVTFPPITDLGWQAGQIRLFEEAWRDPSSAYRIHWFGPNRLSYVLLGAASVLTRPVDTGRATIILLALAWVAGVAWTARARGRSPAALILSCVFFYNHFVYTGFLNFAVGVPVFLSWVVATSASPPARERRGVTIAVSLVWALLLFLSHVLWLAAGVAWLMIGGIVRREPWRAMTLRGVGVLPVLVGAAVWYATLPSGWSAALSYHEPLFASPFSSRAVDYALGGMRGAAAPAVLAALAVWVLAGAWQRRRDIRAASDGALAAAAALMFLMALVLPTGVGTTLGFASRWFPVGCALAVLAAPAPRVSRVVRGLVAATVLVAFCAATAHTWRGFEREEMAGFPEAMETLPARATVLGLDYVRTSPRIKTMPFYLMHGYATVLGDARPNIARVTHPSSLVLYKGYADAWPWTPQLPWHPERVRASDFTHFEYVLLHADADRQSSISAEYGLAPVTAPNVWRLYRVP